MANIGAEEYGETGEFVCPSCKRSQPCSYHVQENTCTGCSSTYVFVTCPKCQHPSAVKSTLRVYSFTGRSFKGTRRVRQTFCDNCSKALTVAKMPRVAFRDLVGKDPAAPMRSSSDSFTEPRLVLQGLQVIDGAGWAPRVGTLVRLLLFNDRFDIGPNNGAIPPATVLLSTLQDLRIEGRSISTGGGFLGGGFGVTGAAEGMAIASVLNSLTAKNRKWVTIELIADLGWVRLQLDGANTLEVRDQLRLLADSVVTRRSLQDGSESPTSDTDLVSALERLVKLRDMNALSEEEFQTAKESLLRPK